jgi:transcriptional regulator GlxA family with amidase domain
VKALTGYSPIEVIRITRLKEARQLLQTTDKTVSEVAYEVGFSSPSYFSKCYRELFGSLPTER